MISSDIQMTSWNMPRLSSKDLINGRMKMILKTVGINFDAIMFNMK